MGLLPGSHKLVLDAARSDDGPTSQVLELAHGDALRRLPLRWEGEFRAAERHNVWFRLRS